MATNATVEKLKALGLRHGEKAVMGLAVILCLLFLFLSFFLRRFFSLFFLLVGHIVCHSDRSGLIR